MRMPGRVVAPEAARPALPHQRLQGVTQGPDMMEVDALDLVDLRGVDVEVGDRPCLRREPGRHARHAIVKARTQRDQKITVLDRVVCERRTVHPEHAHRQRGGRVDRAYAHQRGHDRHLEGTGELGNGSGGIAIDGAAAGVDQRPLGGGQEVEEPGGGGRRQGIAVDGRQALAVARDRQLALAEVGPDPVLDVFRHVDNDRTRPPGTGDLEGGTHRRLETPRIRDQENMLGHRSHQRRNRSLLESVGADGRGRDLAADDDHRHRIGEAVANRSDRIGRARAGRHDADTDLAAGPGVARRHEARALLVGRDDQRHLPGRVVAVVDENGVVRWQDGAAAVAENDLDALVGEHLDDDFGAGQRPAGGRSGLDPGSFRVVHDRIPGKASWPGHTRSRPAPESSNPSPSPSMQRSKNGAMLVLRP